MNELPNDRAAFIKAIANDRRLEVVQRLAQHGELSVSHLNQGIDLSQSALSQHLTVLRREGIVTTRRASQTIYYSLNENLPTRALLTLIGVDTHVADER